MKKQINLQYILDGLRGSTFSTKVHFWVNYTFNIQNTRQLLANHLNVAAVDVHASNHTALSRHICPIDHLLPVVEVQRNSIVQTLGMKSIHEEAGKPLERNVLAQSLKN